MTVEAALAFPVFFYAVMALCVLFTYMEVRVTIGRCMLETARKVSPYGELIMKADPEETLEQLGMTGRILNNFTDDAVVRTILENELSGHPVLDGAIDGGRAGIICAGSELVTEDDCILLRCTYLLKPPVSMFGLNNIRVSQKLRYRYFTGYKVASVLEEKEEDGESEAEETVVYITETGKVYHVSLMCPALNLHIKETTPDDVGALRNEGGGKYKPCERCARGAKPDVLYITTDGDRYHYKLGCSGLKRSIKEVLLEELEGYRACKRCRKDK